MRFFFSLKFDLLSDVCAQTKVHRGEVFAAMRLERYVNIRSLGKKGTRVTAVFKSCRIRDGGCKDEDNQQIQRPKERSRLRCCAILVPGLDVNVLNAGHTQAAVQRQRHHQHHRSPSPCPACSPINESRGQSSQASHPLDLDQVKLGRHQK